MAKKSQRLVVLACTHCGHRYGLTPPAWHEKRHRISGVTDPEARARIQYGNDLGKVQRAFWGWFEDAIDSLGEIDALLFNGDAIDGRQERCGGAELVAPDRLEQVDMATVIANRVRAKQGRRMVIAGTPYHTGKLEEYERQLARNIGAEFAQESFFDFGGKTIHSRHKVGGSSVPHGRATSLSRANTWNEIKAARGKEPRVSMVIRSHVHYHSFVGGPGWLALTTPCLQLQSVYGERECEGDTDIGFLVVDVDNEGNATWETHLMEADVLGRGKVQKL